MYACISATSYSNLLYRKNEIIDYLIIIFFLVLHNIINVFAHLWPYRPGVVRVIEEFKLSVYGDNYDEESAVGGNVSETTKKRKAAAENAVKENANYDWADLADNGKVKLKLLCYASFLVLVAKRGLDYITY